MGGRWDLQGSAYQQSHHCIPTLSSKDPQITLLAAQRKKPHALGLKNAGHFCASVRASLRSQRSLAELNWACRALPGLISPAGKCSAVTPFLHLLGPVPSSPCKPRTSWSDAMLHPIALPCASPVLPFSLGSPRATTAGAAESRSTQKSQSTGCAWHIVWLFPAAFFPCLSLLGIAEIRLQRRYGEVRAHHVTSLTMHPTHACITVLPLLALLAPCGITSDMSGEDLGCEAECFHKQLLQPRRDSAGQHQQMPWSPCASSWTGGRAHPAWGQQETLVALSRHDFYDFYISVSHSCCPTATHTNRNQLQRIWSWRQVKIH